ncbi:MAG: C40 family peptidase [Dermatophilaceae bacterium]
MTASLAAGGLLAALSSPAAAAPPAPAADAVVLVGSASSSVTYGLPVMTKAATSSATKFSGATLSGRAGVAARSVALAAASSAAARVPTPSVATATAAARTVRAVAPVAAAPRGGVLGIAAGLSGVPYSWGGTSPAGFDCSGFTQYVFRQAGVSLPRTAGAQRAASIPVSNPQPGDLIFFGTWHVGIYAGGGMMYDAPTAGQATGMHKIWSNAVTYGRVR